MEVEMNKMTKYWVATASLLYPFISSEKLVTRDQIRRKYLDLFGETLSQNLEQHLISWKDRNADKGMPTRGGSRNRYLFKTNDAVTPDSDGRFRLYKLSDSDFDGVDKSLGPTCPAREEVLDEFHYLIDWYVGNYRESLSELDDESEADSAESEVAHSSLNPTEKESLIKARRGQGVFRTRVASIEAGCRLTGIVEPQFLIASHIKPWARSTNAERLDGNNGLLLSPHVDRLFDRGFITFDHDGSVVIAPEADEVCRIWSIAATQKRLLSLSQEDYMRYHRKHVFRKWIPGSQEIVEI